MNELFKGVIVMTQELRFHRLLWLVLTRWLIIAPAGYCISLQSRTVDISIYATAVQAAFVKMFMTEWEKPKSSGFFSQPTNQLLSLVKLKTEMRFFPLVLHGWCQLYLLRYSSVTWVWAELRLHGRPEVPGCFLCLSCPWNHKFNFCIDCVFVLFFAKHLNSA